VRGRFRDSGLAEGPPRQSSLSALPGEGSAQNVPVSSRTPGPETDHPGVRLFCGGMEFIHADVLDAAIDGGRGETARLDAGAAGPERDFGMAGNFLITVRRSDRHQLGAGALGCHEHRIVRNSIEVTRSPACTAEAAKRNGSMARVGSVRPQVPEMTKCMMGTFVCSGPAVESLGRGVSAIHPCGDGRCKRLW
jgi:hypothetical protein